MNICFIPNLGKKRSTKQPKWGADFFAEAFVKYSPHEVTIQYHLENINDYDLIWVHNIANLLRGIHGRINTVKTLMKRHPPIIGGVRGEIGFKIAKNYLRVFDAIHTSNEKITNNVKTVNTNAFTLSSGVDPSWFTEYTSPETFTVGWAGDTDKNMKNVHILQKLDTPIHIASKQNYIPHHEMPEKFYSKISVLVHPSSHEGSNRVITEAAACALPIICTDVGHNDTIVSHEWIVTLDNPVQDIKNLIERLKQDSELAKTVGLTNQLAARQYSWPDVINRAMKMIDFCVEKDLTE